MSYGEFLSLMEFGREWYRDVWLHPTSADHATRLAILGRLDDYLQAIFPGAFRVSRGFQPYDTFVRRLGLRHATYDALTQWAASQPDGGAAAARQLLDWMTTPGTHLNQLSDQMAALAVIVSFAEMGRGYSQDVRRYFQDWLTNIAAANPATARNLWRSYRDHFFPGLTFAEDGRANFEPDDSDPDSDSDPDADISENEVKSAQRFERKHGSGGQEKRRKI